MRRAMPRLAADASGLRHLRWGREILGALEMHFEHNPRLRPAERDAILEETVTLRALVTALSAAVKPYRDFLERERTRFRGMLRVGAHLVETARGRDEESEAEDIRAGFEAAFAAMEAREVAPRRLALREAVSTLRAGLAEMDKRLHAHVGAAFVESLYPELAAGGTMVGDAGDPDDDAAAAMEPKRGG
jgi:hypothetical protein